MKLSIIIPYFNTKEYTDELLEGLTKQINDEVEIILVDDGSEVPYKTSPDVKVIRQKNKGVSAARNTGLKKAKGEYIVFVDSDDLLSEDYVKEILDAIRCEVDTVYISWKSVDGKLGKIIKNEADEFNPWNRCVWNRVFKKEYIKGLFFNEEMQVAEDDDFLNRLPVPKSKTYISKPIYYYRAGRENSLTQRARKGEFKPRIKTQVVIYCGSMQKIGGIETWIYYWCQNMYQLYDIMVVFKDYMDGKQINRLSDIVQVVRLSDKVIECDTLINTRITDKIPENFKTKRIIQMVHGCYSALFCCDIQPERDKVVFVSQACADTFQNVDKYEVIHNFTFSQEPKKCLLLITASRFTKEKGGNRMIRLAEALRRANIDFIWFVFSHQETPLVEGMVKLPENLNVKDYIAKCDYLVQLSDSEGFGYSIVEALEIGVPVITTPITVLDELGFVEGEDGYIVPFDMENVDVERFLEIPSDPSYKGDNNDHIRKQWRGILGNTKPTGEYLKQGSTVELEIIENYYDMELKQDLKVGEIVTMRKARARLVVGCGKAVIL